MWTLSERLKWARKQHRWTQADLSAASGISLIAIRRLEQSTFEPRLDTIRKLASALSVTPGWLAFRAEPIVDQAGMTDYAEHEKHNGPGTEGLPGYVVLGNGGPWYIGDDRRWTVDLEYRKQLEDMTKHRGKDHER